MRPDPETLRRLYDEGASTRVIGRQFGVSHISVSRWLASAGIPARPTGRGLAHRGVQAPTAEQLRSLVHDQHRSYAEIGALYGVDHTAVPQWLDRHGIERPSVWATRRRGQPAPEISVPDLRSRRAAGESLRSVSLTTGVARKTLAALCARHEIPVDQDGWDGGRRLACSDGHQARSTYEQRVDDWLTDHHLAHTLEPRYPWDRRYRADFLVGDTYVEVWGVTEDPSYATRKAHKIEQCAAAGLDLIEIKYGQFAAGRRWWRPLERLL